MDLDPLCEGIRGPIARRHIAARSLLGLTPRLCLDLSGSGADLGALPLPTGDQIARPQQPRGHAERGTDLRLRHAPHDAFDGSQGSSPEAGRGPAMHDVPAWPQGLSAERRSRHQENCGGARGCALAHAYSVRGANRKAAGRRSDAEIVSARTAGAAGIAVAFA